MTKYVQYVLPVEAWDTGTVDENSNPIWDYIHMDLLSGAVNSYVVNGVFLLWGSAYVGGAVANPHIFQILTNDLTGFKASLQSYIDSLSIPTSAGSTTPIYVFSVDVTLSP